MTNEEILASLPARKLRGKSRGRVLRAHLNAAQFSCLLNAAHRRATNPLELFERIAATVLDHDLINAVLDD